VGLRERLRRGRPGTRPSGDTDEQHLRRWAATHAGDECFVEPRTPVLGTTVLMVDAAGAWTRRRVDGPEAARRLARSLAVPVYDAQVVGYPRRMREHDARVRAERAHRAAPGS
jgi:hypothetical protein